MILLALHSLSALAMLVFLALFYLHNAPGWTNLGALLILACTYGTLFVIASPRLPLASMLRLSPVFRRTLYLVGLVMLPWIFLEAAVVDYYQPLSLFDDAIIALAVSWVLLLAAIVLALVKGDTRLVLAVMIALLGPLLAQGLPSITNPQPSSRALVHSDLFVGGVGGYDIYRIPALLVIPAGSALADREILTAPWTSA